MENEKKPQLPKEAKPPTKRRRSSKAKETVSEPVMPAPVIEVAKSPVVEPAPVPTPVPEEEVKPWKRPCRPMTKREAKGAPRGVRNRQ